MLTFMVLQFQKCSILVKNPSDCPQTNTDTPADDISNQNSGSDNTLLLIFAGGAFLLSIAAVLLVLVRRPVPIDSGLSHFESNESLFKEESMSIMPSSPKQPPVDAIGNSKDGYEWLEWPPDSGNHWYRAENSGGLWSQYGN